MNLLAIKSIDSDKTIDMNWVKYLPDIVGAIPIHNSDSELDTNLILGQFNPDYVILLGGVVSDDSYVTHEVVFQGKPRKVLSLPENPEDDRVSFALDRFSELLEIEYGVHNESIKR